MSLFSIGIIGGSGLYHMDRLSQVQEHNVSTPWGKPSAPLVTGEIDGVPVVFLARHGQNHRLLPSEVPYQANIFAMKRLGVKYLLSLSAVGSLKEDIKPGDLVIPDQYIDFTRQRINTFFGQGAVAHVSMAQPTCPALGTLLNQAAQIWMKEQETHLTVHHGGSYVCIEGPQFSSRAESQWYRSLNASLIGMTNMPEAKLAKEAQIAYGALSMVTDYDCWHPHEDVVTAEMAIARLKQMADTAQAIACHAVELIDSRRPQSDSHRALNMGLVTPLEAMNQEQRRTVEILLK